MATEVLMPKLGLTMTEGTIEEWKFKDCLLYTSDAADEL